MTLMVIKQVAARLQVSMAFVYARIADGSLPHYRLGHGQRGIRVSEKQIENYLKPREHGGEQPKPLAPRKSRVPKLKHLTLD